MITQIVEATVHPLPPKKQKGLFITLACGHERFAGWPNSRPSQVLGKEYDCRDGYCGVQTP